MTTDLYISIIGATAAIIVSVIGAFLANKNSIVLQTRKMKEAHYVAYIEALHNQCANNSTTSLEKYKFERDKLLLIASEEVVKKLLLYEKEGMNLHDDYLTELIKSIRSDLKLKDKNFPKISFMKSRPN